MDKYVYKKDTWYLVTHTWESGFSGETKAEFVMEGISGDTSLMIGSFEIKQWTTSITVEKLLIQENIATKSSLLNRAFFTNEKKEGDEGSDEDTTVAILNSPTYATFEYQGTDKFKTVAEMMDTLDIGNMTLTFDGGVMSKKPRTRFSIVLPAYGETTDTGRALRIVYDKSDEGKEMMKKGGNVVVVSRELEELIKTIPVVNKYYNKG